MATLNGQQINNTYQSLVKFVDNGNAAASLKELTDGQGNELGILVNTTGDFTIEGDATIQGIIDATGANKIAFFYADQTAFPSATNYHGAIAHSHADGKMYFAHGGSWHMIGLDHSLTEYAKIPLGTTGQRPSSPSEGMIRYNTDLSEFEGYSNSWKSIADSADPSILTIENFDGDDTTTVFTLSAAPTSENYTQIYIDGVYQQKDTYEVANTTITFSEAPPAGTGNIEVVNMQKILLNDVITQMTGTDGVTPTLTGTIVDLTIDNDSITNDKLSNRFTDSIDITTLTGSVSYDMSLGSQFKLSGDLTGAYTIDLTGYVKGQIISIYPLKGDAVTLSAQGSSTNTFNKMADAEYDNTVSNILQIECADDSATDPVFFYSVAPFASDNTL